MAKEEIFIGSIPFRSDAEYVQKLIEPYGTAENIEIHADWENPTFEPFAYVTVQTDNLDSLVENLDGKKIGRLYIRVHKRVRI